MKQNFLVGQICWAYYNSVQNPAEVKNHKWKNNVCVRCGSVRERKIAKKKLYDSSRLIRGVFEDVPVYKYSDEWWYGTQHKFERPECKTLHAP